MSSRWRSASDMYCFHHKACQAVKHESRHEFCVHLSPLHLFTWGNVVKLQRDHSGRLSATVACTWVALLVLAGCAGHETVKSSYLGTASMSTDQVTELLTQQGYTGITGLHENGQDWIGEAEKNGQEVSFDIAPNGTIHTK